MWTGEEEEGQYMKKKCVPFFIVVISVLVAVESIACGEKLNRSTLKLKDGSSLNSINNKEKGYAPILYEIKFSNEAQACQDFLAVVNEELKSSPYIDYRDELHFLPWELLSKYTYIRKDLTVWYDKYKPPVAKLTVDIDNDGDKEYLYLMTYTDPLFRQVIYILKSPPESEPKIPNDPNEQSSFFYKFIESQDENFNVIENSIGTRRPIWLKEVEGYSEINPIGFRAEVASYFIYKDKNKNYLVADTLFYVPDSENWYENDPWLVLFEVLDNGQLNKTCILKRIY